MKHRILKILFCGALLVVPGVGRCEPLVPSTARSFSVTEAVRTAFENNKDIQIQSKEIDAARAGILAAQGALLPTVEASGGYTRREYVLDAGSSDADKKDRNILTGYNDDHTAGVSVEKIIYNGGMNARQLEQARGQLKIQEQVLRLKKQNLAFEIKRLYYGLLLAGETERIVQNLVDVAQAHYADVNKKFTEGTVAKFDVLQSKVQVSQWTPELIRMDIF